MLWLHQWCLSCLPSSAERTGESWGECHCPFQCSSSHAVIILLPFYPARGIKIFYTRNLNRTSPGIINFHKIYGIYLLKKKSDFICGEAYKRQKTKTTHSVLANSSRKKFQGKKNDIANLREWQILLRGQMKSWGLWWNWLGSVVVPRTQGAKARGLQVWAQPGHRKVTK